MPESGARRPVFNHLVAPRAGGPVTSSKAKQMLDDYRDEVQVKTRREDAARIRAVKIPNPDGDCEGHVNDVLDRLAAMIERGPQ